MKRQIATLVFVVAAFGVLTCGSASATVGVSTSYIVESCNPYTQDLRSFGGDWEFGRYDAVGIFPRNDCPNGLVFDGDDPAPQGAASFATLRFPADSTLLSAQFNYYGGDESGAYRYVVRSCLELDCPIVYEMEPGGTAEDPHVAQFALAPVTTTHITIFAECVEVICPSAPDFVANDFWLEYADDAYPSVENLETTPAGALDPDSGVWLKGSGLLKAEFDALDADSGVIAAWLGIVRPDVNDPYSDCEGGDSSQVCPRNMHVKTTIDLAGLEDGEHTVRIVVHDQTFMHPYKLDLPLRIDSTPPDEPTGVAFTSSVTKWGWTPEPFVGLAHGDPLDSANNTAHSGWKSAIFDLREGLNAVPLLSSETEDTAGTGEFAFPHEGAWDIGVKYKDGAGNTGNRAHRFVGFDTDHPQPPVFDSPGWIKLSDLYSGASQAWIAPSPDPELESGICGYSFTVDDEPASIPEPEANVLAPDLSATIPTSIGEGRHYVHLRSVACNGLASATVTGSLNVDGTAPNASVVGLGSGGWITSPPNVSIFASDSGSGVDKIEYGFDGDSSLTQHAGSIAPVTVPQGESELSFRAVDAVGNAGTLQKRSIKADWTGPEVEFEGSAAGGQNQVTAVVRDPASGLVTADMQVRRVDSGASGFESSWHTVGGTAAASPEGSHELVLTRGIPDGDLPAGTYEVRVSARDVAGNWSDPVQTRLMTLPMRAGTTLSAAIAKVGAKSKINWPGARQDRVLRYGTKAALVGTLLDAAGAPVPNAALSIMELPEFGVERPFGQATTDENGEFEVLLPKGATRTFTIHFDGSDRLQPATETATIRARAALTLSVSPRRVRSGRPFKFTGRLLSGSLGTPEGGKLVSIEYLRGRTWLPALDARVEADGRFEVKWPPGGLTKNKPTYIYFHAKAKREGTWPFITGSSERIALRLLPPR